MNNTRGLSTIPTQCEVKTIGKVTTIALSSSSRDAVDLLISNYRAYVEASFEAQVPYFLMLDFSHPDVVMTPYLRQEALGAMRATKAIPGYLAVLMTTNLGMTIVSLLLRQQRLQAHTQIFIHYPKALAWLEKVAEKG